MGKISSFITGAAIGLTAGAAAALLLAPQTGEQTRAFVTEKANAVVGEAKDFGAGAPGSAQDVISTVKAKAAGIAGDVSSLVKGGADNTAAAPATDDELRQKIEAARQRIAAQVKENAAQAQAAAEKVEEAVVETAEAAADVADTAKHAAAE